MVSPYRFADIHRLTDWFTNRDQLNYSFGERLCMRHYNELKIFTDGGSRGNPGPAASGIVIFTMDDEVVEAFGRYLGETTNNVAEWSALKFALIEAKKYDPKRIHFLMDSELVCKQLNGQYRVKHPGLRPIFSEVVNLASAYEVDYRHVYRENNKAADAQVNIAIDRALGLKP